MSSQPDASVPQIVCTTDCAAIIRAAPALSPHDMALNRPSVVWPGRAGLGTVIPVSSLSAEVARLRAGGRVPLVIGDGLAALVTSLEGPVGVLHLAAAPQLGDEELGTALLSAAAVSRVVGVSYRHGRGQDMERSKASPQHFPFWDHELALRQAEGVSWRRLCEGMIAALPASVVVVVELSVLAPAICPDADAPLGGLSWAELSVLLWLLGERKRVVGLALRWRADLDPSGRIGAELLQQLTRCALRAGGQR